jgi:hypothetical protein
MARDQQNWKSANTETVSLQDLCLPADGLFDGCHPLMNKNMGELLVCLGVSWPCFPISRSRSQTKHISIKRSHFYAILHYLQEIETG